MPDIHQNTQAMNFDQMQDYAMGIIHTLCGSFSRPIEMILRPWHGTRYFNIAQITLSTLGMLLLPAFAGAADAAKNMVPFMHATPPPGLFDIGSFSKLFFLLSLVHSWRLYRRMIRPETELISDWEGAPLPFFHILPKSRSFWFTRIVLEPLFVFIAATILANLTIITPGLCLFLHFSALCLGIKEFVDWYGNWIFMRNVLDIRNRGPLLTKLMEDTATEEDRAQIHLASFPNVSPELRRETVAHIARTYDLNIHEDTRS